MPSCKVNLNDSDHSYFGIWNDSAQTMRNYLWENFTHGDTVLFMDPYLVHWSNGNRNLCSSPNNGVCTAVDPRWDALRDELGHMVALANSVDLASLTPQPSKSSTGYALASASEYIVYAPSGGQFTVDLSATPGTLNTVWIDPATLATTNAGPTSGGAMHMFTSPAGTNDALLHLY
jgi:hypothetical protein